MRNSTGADLRHHLLGLLLSVSAWSAADEPADAIAAALAQGADAGQIIDLLHARDIPMPEAIVVAIANTPGEMAGELTLEAMSRVSSERQEEVAYEALSAASGVGLCKVAEVMGMQQSAACKQ